MDQVRECALCEQDIENHDVIIVNGTEAYACYGKRESEVIKEKLINWIGAKSNGNSTR